MHLFFRVSYSILTNQFAIYDDLHIDNTEDQVEIRNLSPGSQYTFRFNVQMNGMSGPSVLIKVCTMYCTHVDLISELSKNFLPMQMFTFLIQNFHGFKIVFLWP